jgi:predicted RNA-binding protein YlqC (UPF0109 family)
MEQLIDRLKRLVEFHCREVIDPDHEVTVACVGGAENLLFEISCLQDDVGLIIGRNGRNIDAIRTLVHSACRGASVRTAVEVTNSRR